MALSRSAVDRAGDAIRRSMLSGAPPTPENIAVVEEFRRGYEPTVSEIQRRLTAMENVYRADPEVAEVVARLVADTGHEETTFLFVSSRPKTISSIVAKLARETTRLSQMQDIAGGRIVMPTPDLQDEILAAHHVSHDLYPVIRLTDTRQRGDAHGYRAVHLVLEIEGRPAEVQLRTPLQQIWAQLVESLDQEHGYDLKHGVGPEALLQWLKDLSFALRDAEMGKSTELPSPPTL
jgi:ppGpp synthetase/RelA/SpoT-type nucleotidyltranferase